MYAVSVYALAAFWALGTQEVTRDEMEFVSALRTLLRERVGVGRYELWFGESTHMTRTGRVLCVSAPNQFILDWLQRNFRSDLKACVRQIAQRHKSGQPEQDLALPSVEFQVDKDAAKLAASVAESLPESIPPSQDVGRGNDRHSDEQGSRLASLFPEPISSIPLPTLAVAEHSSRNTPSRDLPGSANLPSDQRAQRRFASLQEYVVGVSNQTAVKAAELVLQQPGALSPYFVHGPSSVGKTHLLEGIWSAARRARRSAIFLTAEQFTSYFVSALRGGGMPSFRRKYRDVDILLIDDLQFICGKKRTEEELLYTIDQLGREGRQVVLAADQQPADLAGLGPELQTRLQAGLACQMTAPELPERMGIVRRFASLREMTLADDVVEFVAEQAGTHARELSGAVNRLFATHLATGEQIDLPNAQRALAETLRRAGPQLQLKEIEKAVCQEFQLEPRQLRSAKKTQDVSQPRMLAMFLARKHTRAALSEIGSYFGGRSHSTVVSAQKKVSQWVKAHQALNCSSGEWTADEAVRRLEARLRVG